MTVSLFSGQGSQYPGMGLDLLAAHPALAVIYDTASSILGFDLKEIIQNSESETLSRTIYAQPAIMATSLICLEAAKKRGFTYDAVAGRPFAGRICSDGGSWYAVAGRRFPGHQGSF